MKKPSVILVVAVLCAFSAFAEERLLYERSITGPYSETSATIRIWGDEGDGSAST